MTDATAAGGNSLVKDTLSGLLVGASWTDRGLYLPPGMEYDAWQQVGATLFWLRDRLDEAQDHVLFAIGDWLQYGEFEYGEKYAQAIELASKSKSRLATVQWVARSIPQERRRSSLSFRHHEEVAGLEPETQDEMLGRAEREGLGSEALREERRRLQNPHYDEDQARHGLDKAVDGLKRINPATWAGIIMGSLVKPLRHETLDGPYRDFIRELRRRLSRWVDLR